MELRPLRRRLRLHKAGLGYTGRIGERPVVAVVSGMGTSLAHAATIRLLDTVDVEWVIVCSEGYTSSLAAAALLDIGLLRATDVVGGYHALAGAGVLAELAGDSINPAGLANTGATGRRWI